MANQAVPGRSRSSATEAPQLQRPRGPRSGSDATQSTRSDTVRGEGICHHRDINSNDSRDPTRFNCQLWDEGFTLIRCRIARFLRVTKTCFALVILRKSWCWLLVSQIQSIVWNFNIHFPWPLCGMLQQWWTTPIGRSSESPAEFLALNILCALQAGHPARAAQQMSQDLQHPPIRCS